MSNKSKKSPEKVGEKVLEKDEKNIDLISIESTQMTEAQSENPIKKKRKGKSHSLCFEYILASMMTFCLYVAAYSPLYKDMNQVTDRIVDDAMAFDPSGIIKGSGSQSGSIDKNFHIAQHNDRVMIFAKTKLDFDDFANFTQNDKSCQGLLSVLELIEQESIVSQGVSKKDFRHLLSLYLDDKIRYSDKSTHILERLRDPQRSYFAHKAAKDFIILTGNNQFYKQDMVKIFETNSLVNYLNDMVLNIIDQYLQMIYQFKIEYDPLLAISDPYVNHQSRYKIPGIREMQPHIEFNLSHADLQLELAHKMDTAYLFVADMMLYNSFKYFHEPLLDYESFETQNGINTYFPLVDPKYPVVYFEFPKEFYEEKRYEQSFEPTMCYEHMVKMTRMDHQLKISPFSLNTGSEKMMEMLYYDYVTQWDLYIMRGVHIKVYNYGGVVISDEFESPQFNQQSVTKMMTSDKKVFWYKRLEHIWPKCLQQYFDTEVMENFETMEIIWIRCPPWDSNSDEETQRANKDLHEGSDDDYFFKRFNVQKYQGFEVQLQTIW